MTKQTKRATSGKPKVASKKSQKKKSIKKLSLKDPNAQREALTYSNPIASRELILKVISQYGALDFSGVKTVLGLEDPEQIEALSRRLKAMVRDGQLIRNRREGFIPVNEASLIRGRVIAHPEGFGFLVPDEGGDDLFLSARQMRTLLHGDRAVVQVSGIDRRGRREGSVVEVIERANQRIVGRLFIESGVAYVVPDNKRLTQDIMVSAEHVGEARHGQIVIVDIIEQPTFRRQPIGRIADVLGDHMAAGMEIDIAIQSHGIPFEWPQDLLEEIEEFSQYTISEEEMQPREDIRHIPLVTIDGEDSRDFDDAVFCKKTSSGWKLWVSIADVSHYVKPDTALDEEACKRATSVYFPNRVVPMLPEVLSNDLCSINPHVDRLCMVCEMLIDREGNLVRSRFFEGLMRSHARLTYNEVAKMLVQKNAKLCNKYQALLPHLQELYALYKVLAQHREKRGAIDFETTETRVVFDADQRIERIVPTERNDAHRLIEECMISANVAAARFLGRHKIPGLSRIHEPPALEKLENVRDFLGELGLSLGRRGKEATASDYAELVNKIKGRADFHLIQTVLLRSLSQAVYSPEHLIGHFGLSLERYAHFTSPIRRYPDLLVHRAIRHVLRGGTADNFYYRRDQMVTLGEHCSACERRADDASRDAMMTLKCEYMLDKVGEEFDGIISGVTSFGVFVELTDIYVEGLVHITSLPKDYYQFEPVGHRLIGERGGLVFRLGDAVRVKLANVNMDERKIDFDLVTHKQAKRKRRKSKPKSAPA